MAHSSSENSTFDPDHSRLVKTVYKTVWDDFYDWEQAHCLQTLHSLSRVLPDDVSYDRNKFVNGVGSTSRSFPLRRSQVSNRENETFTVIDYSVDGEPETATLQVVTVQCTRPLEPCAPYEICTPTNRNITVEDDSEYMPFIPFIDDPTFNSLRHAEDYKYFHWQKPDRDPDLEVIVTRTVADLHHKHQLSFEAIDETGILPFPVRSHIFNSARRRDFPKWPAMKLQLPYAPSHAIANAPERLALLVNDFCSNMNCLIGYCNVHMKDMPMPGSVPPTILSNELVHSVVESCGSDCFLLKNISSSLSPWSNEDVEVLTTVLSLSPDLSPCNIAIVCRKPCFEVFKHRRRLIPDSTISKANKLGEKSLKRPTRSATLRYDDHDSTIFTPLSGIGLARILDRVMPVLVVRVLKTMRIASKAAAVTRNVPDGGVAVLAPRNHRIPAGLTNVHVSLHAESVIQRSASSVRQDFERDICKNVSIQRGDRKRTQVRQSKWGLGLYIDEEAQKDDLILEYTGELVCETTALCRDFVSMHRKRSYLFTLNPTFAADSTKLGNESRFINHDSNANCHARVRLVNGEHRIGIFAWHHIPPGTELSLNYGDSFFDKDGADSAADDPGQSAPTPDFAFDQVVYNLDQHSSDETYAGSETGTTVDF